MESKVYSRLAVVVLAAIAFATGGKAHAATIKSDALIGFVYATIDTLKAPLLIYPDSHHILSVH